MPHIRERDRLLNVAASATAVTLERFRGWTSAGELRRFGSRSKRSSDYSEASVLLTPDGAIRGLAGIRAFFEGAYAEFGQPGNG